MKTIWIPCAPAKSFLKIEASPFEKLERQTRAQLNEGRAQPAAERRLEVPGFVETVLFSNIVTPPVREHRAHYPYLVVYPDIKGRSPWKKNG